MTDDLNFSILLTSLNTYAATIEDTFFLVLAASDIGVSIGKPLSARLVRIQADPEVREWTADSDSLGLILLPPLPIDNLIVWRAELWSPVWAPGAEGVIDSLSRSLHYNHPLIRALAGGNAMAASQELDRLAEEAHATLDSWGLKRLMSTSGAFLADGKPDSATQLLGPGAEAGLRFLATEGPPAQSVTTT